MAGTMAAPSHGGSGAGAAATGAGAETIEEKNEPSLPAIVVGGAISSS